MGPAELAAGDELTAGPNWQRADRGYQDRVIVEPGAGSLERFDRAAR